MSNCPACDGDQEIELPFNGDIEIFDCPCCKPWQDGFSGLGFFVGQEWVWLIFPSEPNQAAVHHTQKKEMREKNGVFQPE